MCDLCVCSTEQVTHNMCGSCQQGSIPGVAVSMCIGFLHVTLLVVVQMNLQCLQSNSLCCVASHCLCCAGMQLPPTVTPA
jgi:hypothetical protein